ncbi:DUF1203 domain-containing protein [uncultured Pelagimonas sp.]|uniref:DUF1203 domain-containing protein n=1 Tax=uncultured Pelagimonas sp. TaxID=1618102 RepID=UPI00261351E1|nr:DUF1203 domain-containing protein [uncultured Pelagimonas sp.]
MTIYNGLTTDRARHYQWGGADAYGLKPEHVIAEGSGNPCRHCLKPVCEGQGMLILAHRPFGTLQPYAETGPIFLCADECEAHLDGEHPSVLSLSPQYLIKAYTSDERILYGTGEVVSQSNLESEIGKRFEMPRVAFVDVRSARNNCWLARAYRDGVDAGS